MPVRSRKIGVVDVATDLPIGSAKIGRLLREIEALIADDEAADRQVTGGWKTFGDILAAAHVHTWDAYSVDLSTDAESFRRLAGRQQEAVKRVFGTIYCAESIVDDWMGRIVAAVPQKPELRGDARGAHDAGARRADAPRQPAPGRDRGSRDPRADVDQMAKKYNNFVAEILFDRFEDEMRHLLRPNRPLEDLYTAIFIYGVLSEDVVANSDVVIRRAKGNALYDAYDLPG